MKSKIFNALLCSLCKSPYSLTKDHPKRALRLECGNGVCSECFEIEKRKEKPKQKHQCQSLFDCYSNVKPAFFINMLLTEAKLVPNFVESPPKPKPGWSAWAYGYVTSFFATPTIIESTSGHGYHLGKIFKAPECPICLENYSIETKKQHPFALHCGHTICVKCFEKLNSTQPENPNRIACPICNDVSIYRLTTSRNQLLEFLEELPGMLDELMRISACEKDEETFQECKNELKSISFDTRASLGPQLEAYDIYFPVLQDDLNKSIIDFQKTIYQKADCIQNSTFSNVQKERDACLEFGQKFEDASEEYMMALRIYTSKIMKLKEECGDCC